MPAIAKQAAIGTHLGGCRRKRRGGAHTETSFFSRPSTCIQTSLRTVPRTHNATYNRHVHSGSGRGNHTKDQFRLPTWHLRERGYGVRELQAGDVLNGNRGQNPPDLQELRQGHIFSGLHLMHTLPHQHGFTTRRTRPIGVHCPRRVLLNPRWDRSRVPPKPLLLTGDHHPHPMPYRDHFPSSGHSMRPRDTDSGVFGLGVWNSMDNPVLNRSGWVGDIQESAAFTP